MQRLQIKPKLDFALLKIEKVFFCVHWFIEYFNGFRLYFKEIRSLYAGNTKISEAFLGVFHSCAIKYYSFSSQPITTKQSNLNTNAV